MSNGLSNTSAVSEKALVGEYGITIVKPTASRATYGVLCFGSAPVSNATENLHVPFKNVLFCENSSSSEVDLTYAVVDGEKIEIHQDCLDVGAYTLDSLPDMAHHIMLLSYQQGSKIPRVMIVLNNFGGQGNARKIYQSQILPVLQAAHVEYAYMETEYSGHASDIARELELSEYDIIACCSGDGVPHEVMNGFYQRADREQAFEQIAITQLPCGSGNALSLSSFGTNSAGIAAVKMLKLARKRMDAMAVTQGSTTKISFLSQAYGIIADSDIGTEHLRWMGPMRFDFGVTQRLITNTTYPCDLFVKYVLRDNDEIQGHYNKHRFNPVDDRGATELELVARFPTFDVLPPADWEQLPREITDNLSIFYVGKMPYVLSDAQFFPAALPNDGCMDMIITSAKTSFFKMAKLLFSIDKGRHIDSPDVLHAKISAYRLVPRIGAENHFISVDGESFPFEPLQVEVLSRTLTVLLDEGAFVDTCLTGGS
ncbi:hypothetical protein METBIDRAFT_36414 [Metschnikowia bicuspidata var. bicuspidata NRRL YB-4993]|uniref:DAGKc domain-containing protein n=1 Tax=Metschnikowia bicuspidata var. bicuspidata NRRL YB-4993 TaxID=869754 RepID=A0A1A0HHJ2_9ASCO|nr:hypothetical protein METBIDRAFT_36414 [Metschnikowia bicuspidata var. bicuspidata NRRL YB-4993]OBA23347.1 hypothetical protein METBIDRAFT_36414 [Metschnikowia bicuspidata var. bicuspidata NRRL YB-4993]